MACENDMWSENKKKKKKKIKVITQTMNFQRWLPAFSPFPTMFLNASSPSSLKFGTV